MIRGHCEEITIKEPQVEDEVSGSVVAALFGFGC